MFSTEPVLMLLHLARLIVLKLCIYCFNVFFAYVFSYSLNSIVILLAGA